MEGGETMNGDIFLDIRTEFKYEIVANGYQCEAIYSTAELLVLGLVSCYN